MNTTHAPSAAIEGHDGLLLGYEPMDQVHQEFVQCVADLQQAPDAQLAEHMDALLEHARRHFGDEDRWMQETQFPARECHIDEHAQVMQSIVQVRQLVAQGQFEVCRRLARELASWFPGHADYLDSALAAWMCKREHGGKPVVLHRRLGGLA